MATSIPSPSPTVSAQATTNLTTIIAAAAGGAAIFLIFSVFAAFLLIRRKRRRREKKVFLRGRTAKIPPSIRSGNSGRGGLPQSSRSGGGRGELPLQYPPRTIMVAVDTGRRPSFSREMVRAPQIARPVPAFQGGRGPPGRPTRMHERYPAPYSSMTLERVYETLERRITTSPTPSFVSGRTEGAASGVASPQPSSDLNHGRSFRSLDQSPPRAISNPLFAQAIDAQKGVEIYSTPAPVVRRPSEIKRAELLAALDSTEIVVVVKRPGLSSRPSTGNNAPRTSRDRYRPP